MTVLWTLLASGVVNLVAGGAFAWVGLRFRRRQVDRGNRLAMEAFALYWVGVGLYTASWGGLLDVLAALGVAPFGLFLAVRYASVPVVCVALGSLLFYFAYVWTGRKAWLWVTALLYGAVLVAGVAHVHARHPIGVSVQAWRTDLAYQEPFAGGGFGLVLLGLVVPPMLGALAYAMVAFRLPRGASRTRVLLVAAAILVWSAAALLARVSESDAWQLLTRPVLGLAVAALVLYAYRGRPPHEDAPRRGE